MSVATAGPRKELKVEGRTECAAGIGVVAVAASAGGLAALTSLLERLPADFPSAVVVVQHLDPRHRSVLAEILTRRTPLAVKEAGDGDRLEPAHVYVAPPNRHLLVNAEGTVSLSEAELVRFLRPSADTLFKSVAAAFGERAIAVVLTGTGSDGADGVTAVKRRGGTVIVQDEASSEFFGMPESAIRTGSADMVLPLDRIPSALEALVSRERRE